MDRFLCLLVVAAAIAAGSLSFDVARAQEPGAAAAKIEITPLGGGVAMLRGRGGNQAVSVGPDGILVVDAEYANLADEVIAAIEKLAPGGPRFVIDTHWHGDHTGGNARLVAAGGLVLAHDAVRTRMSREQFIEAFGRKVPASPEAARPVVTYSETLTVHWNGGAVRVVHVPRAHTDGDSLVVFEAADVLHTGDVFFVGSFPFIDLSSGGSLDGVIAAAERALTLAGPDTRIIPGHGPLADRAELQAYVEMLTTVRDRLVSFVAEGLSTDEVIARRPASEFEERYGGGAFGAEHFLRIAYESIRARD
jgi:glyoxylase-like metal-dependent hydrolase (beta-lactamase superfamily II)